MPCTGSRLAAACAGVMLLGLTACQPVDTDPPDGGASSDAASSTPCTVDEECGIGASCVDGSCGPCLEGSACNEACEDWAANAVDLMTVGNTWNLGQRAVSNGGVISSFTHEARRCQWTRLSDRCGLVNCLRSDWPGEASTLTGPSAGAVTISNARGFSEVFEPDANGFYPLRNTTRWLAGDQITVEAVGDEVPAYHRSYLFPEAVTVTSAMAGDDDALLAVDVSEPFVATWEPFAGTVIVDFAQGLPYDDMDYQELTCEFDAAAGSATIEAAVMQHLRTGADLQTGLGVAAAVRHCFQVGEFHLQTLAVSGPWRDITVQ